MDSKPEYKETEKVDILPGENNFENFLTIAEVEEFTSKPSDEIIRMLADCKMQCYFPLTIEKIMVGTLGVIPTEENIKSNDHQNYPSWCATPISQHLEEILDQSPEYFDALREEFPRGLILRLDTHQAGRLLTENNIFVKYGRFPNGYYFKVVSPQVGLD